MNPMLALPVALALAFGALPPEVHAKSLFGAARSSLAKKSAKPALQKAEARAVDAKPRDVVISRSRHRQAAEHIEHAQRNGQPTVLHIDRQGAPQNRHDSTGRVKLNPKPAPGYERDQYPPAFTREGGHNANIRFINPHDNRGAGAVMRAQTQGLPDNAKIRVLVGP